MATMAAAGIGITCLPRFIGDATPGLRCLPTPVPAPERALWLGAHRDSRTIPRVRASIAFLSESIGRLRAALCPGLAKSAGGGRATTVARDAPGRPSD